MNNGIDDKGIKINNSPIIIKEMIRQVGFQKDEKEFEWKPWDDYKPNENDKLIDLDITLPIINPPCTNCNKWNPRRVFDSEGRYAGVRMCFASERFGDFSCFRNKEKIK